MSDKQSVSRRSLIAGVGAIGGAAALGSAAAAAATPHHNGSSGAAHPNALPSGFPTPIGSAPVAGVSYRYRMFEDFFPESTVNRTYGGEGITGPSGLFCATFDLPPGAVLADVEWYYVNTSSSTFTGICRVWGAGQGGFLFTGVDVDLPMTNGLAAVRAVVPSSGNGPFPLGTRIVTGVAIGSALQIEGVRVGMRNAPLSPVLLTTPARVYDSRNSSPIEAGQSRTISLSSHLPVGANGAMYTLSVLNTNGAGALHVGAAGSSFAAVGIQWARTGDRMSAPVTCAVNGSRAIGVQSVAGNGPTDFIVDLTGYLV